MRSPRYEAMPARISIPLAPRFAHNAIPKERSTEREKFCLPEELQVAGAFALPSCVAKAQHLAQELLRECHSRVRRGDRAAISDLLAMNTAFIADRWVCKTALRLLEGGLSGRKRGRPHSTFKAHPLLVYGLVTHLIEMGRAENPEQAFRQLEELYFLSHDSAKRSFYQARSEKRFRPVLIEHGEPVESSPEEYEAGLRRGRILERGDEVSLDPKEVAGLGSVTLTLRGGDEVQGAKSRAYFELRRITLAWQGGDEVPGLRRAFSRRER